MNLEEWWDLGKQVHQRNMLEPCTHKKKKLTHATKKSQIQIKLNNLQAKNNSENNQEEIHNLNGPRKAFDNVWWNYLKQVLKKFHFNKKTRKLIKTFY